MFKSGHLRWGRRSLFARNGLVASLRAVRSFGFPPLLPGMNGYVASGPRLARGRCLPLFTWTIRGFYFLPVRGGWARSTFVVLKGLRFGTQHAENRKRIRTESRFLGKSGKKSGEADGCLDAEMNEAGAVFLPHSAVFLSDQNRP